MKKIFYKIFITFCLVAYLPLICIYIFNFLYVDKYINEDKKTTLIEIAENVDIVKLKQLKHEKIKYNNSDSEIGIRYVDFNRPSDEAEFFKLFNRSRIEKGIDIKDMEIGNYEIVKIKLSSVTNHFFLVKKISNTEIVVVIAEVIESDVVLAIMLGLYKQYSLFVVPLLLVASFILSKKFSQPIEILEKISTQVSNSDFTEIVEIKSKNELESLGNNINKMASKLKQNIEELNLLNDKLKLELKEKEKLLETEKTFMRTIGHELKTPIAIINGYIEALQDDLIKKDEIKKTYGIIYNEGMGIDKIVKDINEYLKLGFKNLRPIYEKKELQELIVENLEKYKLDMCQKGIKLVEKYTLSQVQVDIKLFNIILNNLFTNAITYVDNRKIIEIELKKDRLIIQNSTNRIDKKDLEQIFNPFYKLDSSRNRKYGGTGLGLSIVKNLLETLKFKYSFLYDEERGFAVFTVIFF